MGPIIKLFSDLPKPFSSSDNKFNHNHSNLSVGRSKPLGAMRSPSATRLKTLKTLVTIAATLLVVSAGADVPMEEGAPRRSLKPLNWIQHMSDFGNAGFQQMYRMPIHRFYELLDGKPGEAG